MNNTYPFELMPLPFDYSSLEPYIDTETLHYHHDRHLATYVEKLNNILKDYPAFQKWDLEKLIIRNKMLPIKIQEGVFNNAGGVYNHEFYFSMLSNNSSKEPYGNLLKAINKKFGSYDAFKKEMKDIALSQFGSGYAWLVCNKCGNLSIIKTSNQETNLNFCLEKILTVDVWEHAYYLKHKNLRGDYISDWFEVINWDEAERLYTTYLYGIN